MKMTIPNDLGTASDAELIQLSVQGDQNSYGQIVERYQSLVCTIANSRCGNLALSEDLAQDAFILAWQKLGDLKDISKFKSWIGSIVRNLANRAMQQSVNSVNRATHLDAVAEISTENSSPEERVVSAEEETLVWQALADIPENYREPLVLFYREEHSIARVAAALELSEDAVKQRLSRGRNMLRQHVAAVVESTLICSKPTKVFTGAVLLGLSGPAAKSAAAAGVATATTFGAKTTMGVGAGSGLIGIFLWPLLNLPLVAWLFKSSYDETRSESERQLLNRSYFFAFCGFMLFVAALISSFWLSDYIEPHFLRALIPGLLMVVFLIPWIIYCRKMGKQIEHIRKAEGTNTALRPLVKSDHNGSMIAKTYGVFCLSAVLVLVGPALFLFALNDWLILSAMFVSALCISLIAAKISFRFPNHAFQLFGFSNGITALITIGFLYGRGVWEASPIDQFQLSWSMGAMSAAIFTNVILTTIAWKRVYSKPELPDKGV